MHKQDICIALEILDKPNLALCTSDKVLAIRRGGQAATMIPWKTNVGIITENVTYIL